MVTLERARVLLSRALLIISRVIFLSLAILRWRDGGGVGSHLWGHFDPVSHAASK